MINSHPVHQFRAPSHDLFIEGAATNSITPRSVTVQRSDGFCTLLYCGCSESVHLATYSSHTLSYCSSASGSQVLLRVCCRYGRSTLFFPEGRAFDSRWCHWKFFIDIILPAVLWPWGLTHPLTEMSTRNVSWGEKAAGA